MTRYVQKLVTIINIKFIGSKDVFSKKDSITHLIRNDFRFIAHDYHERFIQNTEDEEASSGRRDLLPYQRRPRRDDQSPE